MPDAAIEIDRDVIRYAELSYRDDNEGHLRRLGACDFEVDVARLLLDPDAEPDDNDMQAVLEALREAFGDTSAPCLRLVVHPTDSYAFVVPLPADPDTAQRRRLILQQASLLTGIRQPRAMYLTTEPLGRETVVVRGTGASGDAASGDAASGETGSAGAGPGEAEPATDEPAAAAGAEQAERQEEVRYEQIIVTPAPVQARVQRIVEALPFPDYRWTLSTGAAAAVALLAEQDYASATLALKPYTLAVGLYPTHTEYGVCHDGHWRYSHHAEATLPDDRVYYVVALLNRMRVPIDLVGRLFIYGTALDSATLRPFRAIFGVQPEPLDPASLLVEGASTVDAPPAYAPCVGALL
jgi:hypothetical protein